VCGLAVNRRISHVGAIKLWTIWAIGDEHGPFPFPFPFDVSLSGGTKKYDTI
jgi:hypothetical protein